MALVIRTFVVTPHEVLWLEVALQLVEVKQKNSDLW